MQYFTLKVVLNESDKKYHNTVEQDTQKIMLLIQHQW